MKHIPYSIKENNSFPFFHFRPAIFICISVVLGILCVWNLMKGEAVIAIVSALFLIGLCAIPILERKQCKRGEVFALIVLSCIFFLSSGTITAFKIYHFRTTDINDGYYTIRGTITDISKGEELWTFSLSELSFSSFEETTKSFSNMQLFVSEHDENAFKIGDRITCYSRVTKQKDSDTFGTYLMLNDYKYRAFSSKNEISVVGKGDNVFLKTRIALENVLNKEMTRGADGIAIALLFGNTDGIEEGELQLFRDLGLSHVFAVSGLHIGFLCAFLLFFFRKVGKRNVFRFLIPSGIIFFYAGICGFSPSALRAAIMCTTSLFLTVIGAPNDRFNRVLFSAIVILLINPIDLFSYGFQLSYVCVLSLLFVSPIIKDKLKFLPNKIGESISVVVGIQLGVFPLQMILFGSASPIAILLNLIFIPIVSIIYYLLVLSLIIVLIIPSFSLLLRILSLFLGSLSLLMKEIFSPNLTINGWIFNHSIGFYYAGLIVGSPIINVKLKIKRILVGILMVITLFLTIFASI